MDVQCERCKTEYEFDDALVSGRGTTVRCTTCGHQFKVRRPDTGDATGDRWLVQTASGPQLTFLTLRELQRAILAKQVSRHDLLVLGDAPPRPLREITELEPFFEGRASSRPPPAATNSVPHHSQPPPPPMRRTQSFHALPEPPPNLPPRAIPPAFLEPSSGPLHPAEHAPVRPGPTPRMTERFPGPSPVPPVSVGASGVEDRVSSVLPPPTDPVRRGAFDEDLRLADDAFPSSSDEAYGIPGRRRVGGWVVAFVLVLAVGVVGWVVAKPYVLARNSAAATKLDARAQSFLNDGERAMADGDLETSQQAFDKASALAERDPRVLLDEARVAAARADVLWLKLRLLPAESAEELRTTKAQLEERIVRARRAADEAIAVAPEDAAAARANIDALRLAGDREDARRNVAKVSAIAHQPETAYVLAALDLAEPAPLWGTVIERLRLAAAGEANAGRARAALVYALAKSGDVPAAKAELAKLDSLTRPYPCSPNLHTLVDQPPPPKALPERTTGAAAPRANPVAPPALAPPAGASMPSGDGVAGEQSNAMQAAAQAFKKADFNRAKRIYETLVNRNPDDSEALAGIGDVARAQGDASGAIAAYKRALAVNPSYLPALLGVADTEWANGDRVSAQRAYNDITERFPDGTYPAHVKTRAESTAAVTPPATTPPAATAPSASAKPYDPGDGI
ncbi:MAG: tetratricopeptide repeat protein [Polyangiaceae bacterium]